MAYFDPYATLKKTLFFIFLNTVPFLITIPLYEFYAYLSFLVLIPVFGLINFLVSDKWWQSFLWTGVMTLFSGLGLFFSLALDAGEGNLSGIRLLFTGDFDSSSRLFFAVLGEVLIGTLLVAPLLRLLVLWICKRCKKNIKESAILRNFNDPINGRLFAFSIVPFLCSFLVFFFGVGSIILFPLLQVIVSFVNGWNTWNWKCYLLNQGAMFFSSMGMIFVNLFCYSITAGGCTVFSFFVEEEVWILLICLGISGAVTVAATGIGALIRLIVKPRGY